MRRPPRRLVRRPPASTSNISPVRSAGVRCCVARSAADERLFVPTSLGRIARAEGITGLGAVGLEELERLRESLGKLRKWERELLVKRFCEGYTIAMLAQEAMFWSESTIRNRLTQALEHLRKIYRRTERAEG